MQEFLVNLETEETLDMPSNRDRIESLETRLDAIELQLSEIGPHPGIPSKRTKHSKFWPTNLTEWAQVVGVAFSVFVAACGFTYFVGGLMMDSRITQALVPVNSQLTSIDGDVKAIKATLDAWRPFIAPEVLKNSTSLSPEEFKKSLSKLNHALQTVAETNIAVPQQTLSEIALKLRAVQESSPDYWPTVLRFIQFASGSLVPSADVPPPDARFAQMSNITCRGTAHCVSANHCAVILDGGDIPNSIFDHCRIRFTNNPVGLAGTHFIDCVFEMPTNITQPTPYLKRSAKALLASNLRQVTFPG